MLRNVKSYIFRHNVYKLTVLSTGQCQCGKTLLIRLWVEKIITVIYKKSSMANGHLPVFCILRNDSRELMVSQCTQP